MTLSIAVTGWQTFLLVLARVASLVMVAPVFGAKPIPTQVKVGLSVLLAALLTPLQANLVAPPAGWFGLLLAVSRESLVGLLMGFAGVLVFSGIQMAAHLISVQIGFGFAFTVDPLSGENGSFLETFYSMLALLIFLGLGGHHAVLAGLSRSFELIPLGEYGPTSLVSARLLTLSSAAFATATHLAMPALATMLLTDMATALVVRSMPQMNIFAVGLPAKMVVGLFTLGAVMPFTFLGIGDLSRRIALAVGGVLP